jgi:hypothetical protein
MVANAPHASKRPLGNDQSQGVVNGTTPAVIVPDATPINSCLTDADALPGGSSLRSSNRPPTFVATRRSYVGGPHAR